MVYNILVNCIINGVPQGSSKVYWDGVAYNINNVWTTLTADGSHSLRAALIDNSNQYKFSAFYIYWDDNTFGWLSTPEITVVKGGYVNVHYVTVDPLNVFCNPNDVTVEKGNSVTFTAGAVGGVEPYTFEWNLGWLPSDDPNRLQSGPTITLTFSNAGPYTIGLAVIDARTVVSTVAVNITVTEPPPPPPPPPVKAGFPWWIVALIVVGAVTVTAVAASREKKKTNVRIFK